MAICLALLVAAAAAQAPVYKFRPERVAVGTVYHYLKTNVDGSQAENISTYIASSERIESFKYHEKGTRSGLVIADMDWKNFMARRLESWQVFGKDERRLFATLEYSPSDQSITVSIPAAKPEPETVKVGRIPFHLYNFDLASLNVAWPHLVDPRKPFVVGIADPTFAHGPLVAYKGEMAVTYERDEARNGVETRRYAAKGKGIGGEGTIWVNKEFGHIEDMEFNVANNPDWKTFKLKLIKTETRTPAQWQEFIASRF